MARGLKAVSNRRNDALSRIGWDRLESLLAEHYRQQGYEVEHVGTGATKSRFDGGIDLKLRRDDAYILVQSKHWNAYKVTHNAVHELLGLMVNEGATGAILITSGEFTRAAIEASARHRHVQLVDGDDLRGLLGPLIDAETDRGERFAGNFMRTVSASPTARRLADAAKERLVSEVEQGIRGGGVAILARKAAMDSLWLVLLKLAFALLALWLLGRGVTASIQGITQPRASATLPASPVNVWREALPAPTQNAAGLMQNQTTEVDMQAGQVPAITRPTTAEIRESQRRADEAMRVIESSTPEM